MSTIVIALIFMGGCAAVCAVCALIAGLIHRSGIAERLWK